MSNTRERRINRLREALSFVAQHDGAASQYSVFAHVAEMFPPEGDELTLSAQEIPAWRVTFVFHTSILVHAGWMTKDGKGNWTVTEIGRAALQQYPDSEAFEAEARHLYDVVIAERKAEQRRAWLVRGSSVRGSNIVSEWLQGGWVSLSASQLRPIEAGIGVDELKTIAESDYEHLKHQELKSKVNEILAFVTKMAAGDVVLTTSDQLIYVGDVTGDWSWHSSESGRSNLRRQVEWRNADAAIDFAELPAPLPAKLASGATIVDLTAELDIIDQLATPPAEGTNGTAKAGSGEPKPLHEHLPYPGVGLADELLVDSGWLTGVRDLLDERKQIIFYGPPGTGKTFLARKLAADLVGPEQVKLVQFHPAYSYEDFFEGYRPRSENEGTIGFDLKPGPLRQLVSRAIEHREQAFVLIIDEINRANLAKVFGELYFLLEYRDEAVELLYSAGDEPFTLPPNIYIIGTMNTADRSIALVDSAMRRRFAFVSLDPRTEPTRSLLRRWSVHHGLPSVAADLLDKLNERIDDPDFQVGPSYFMKSSSANAFSPARLETIWTADIQPLLEEHFYGQWDTYANRFSLDSILKASTDISGDKFGLSAPALPVQANDEPSYSVKEPATGEDP